MDSLLELIKIIKTYYVKCPKYGKFYDYKGLLNILKKLKPGAEIIVYDESEVNPYEKE